MKPNDFNDGTEYAAAQSVGDVSVSKEIEFWEPRACRQPGHPCADTAFAKGERCSWCGLGEDGSYD
jgi:hypothetical protein